MRLVEQVFQESGIPLSPRQFWRYSFYFWGSLAVLSYLQVTVYELLIDHEMFYTENLQWLVRWGLWIAATPFVLYAAHHFPVGKPLPLFQLLRRLGLHMLLLSLIGLLFSAIEYVLVEGFYQLEAGVSLQPRQIFVWLFSRYNTLVALYMLVVLSYTIIVNLYQNQALHERALQVQLTNEQLNSQLAGIHLQAAQADLANEQLKSQLAQAHLQALRMQLNPHFLFNTHHTIIGLMMQNDNEKAIEMVKSLSALLRAIVDYKDINLVTLAQEISFIEQYLRIQQIRFQDRLNTQILLEPGSETGLLPQFILQPLVENAFVHGLEKVAGPICLTIRAHRRDDQLTVSVHDNGLGFGSSRKQGRSGVGISNTRLRLQQTYDTCATLTYERPPTGGTAAVLTVPFLTEADTDDTGAGN